MSADDLTALIGPPADDRVRTVLKPRGPQPPRVHPDFRALLASPLPVDAPQPGSGSVAALALIAGLLTAGLLLVIVTVMMP